MLSLSYKGISLERSMGSTRFALLVVYSLLMSHSIAVILAAVLHSQHLAWSGYNQCAVGFSAVLFCMKYIWNQRSSEATCIYGFSIPTKYAAWAECVLISLLTPNVSFIGHLSGILAGVIFIHVPRIIRTTRVGTYFRGMVGERLAERRYADNIQLYEDENHYANSAASDNRGYSYPTQRQASQAPAVEPNDVRQRRIDRFNR